VDNRIFQILPMGESEVNPSVRMPPELADRLHTICASEGFRRSPRLQRFLRYVVQEALSSPDRPLKEVQIAANVFDRRPGFDPQIDPIVRVEAGRLRLRLTEYYAGPGQDDPILIEIGKGGYLPTFRQGPGEVPRRGTEGVANTSAYRLYLKGRYFWGKRTAEGLKKANEYYLRALAADSAFALAKIGIADCHLVSATFEFAAPERTVEKAREAAETVLQQSSLHAEAHTTLACIKAFYDRDWRAAKAGFKRAIAIDPNYATAWQWHGVCCCALGRLTEGLAALKTGMECDPLSPMTNTLLACGLYLAKRYEEAEAASNLALEMYPDFWPARYFLGLIYEQRNLFAQAVRELRHAAELSGGNSLPLAALAHAHAGAGGRRDAMAILTELETNVRFMSRHGLSR
jgi:tetratricopeptide (TPR) repeat protein